MPENKTELQKTAEEVVPMPKKPMPSKEAIADAIAILQAAEEAQVEGGEFGPGKPGKKPYTIPKTPPHLGMLTIGYEVEIKGKDGKTIRQARERRYAPGSVHKLTHDEIHEIEYRLDRLVRNEMVGRYGVGVEKKILIDLTTSQKEGVHHSLLHGNGPHTF